MPESEQAEIHYLKRQRRKSCLIKILIFWFSLMAIIILAMIFIRSRVSRDSVEIDRYVAGLFEMTLPDGFKSYSKSDFFSAHSISYWDESHLREDGRTTSLIAIYFEDKWRNWDLQTLKDKALATMETRLDRNGFHTESRQTLTFEQGGKTIEIFRFDGLTRLEEVLHDATTCYRFVMTAVGPVQIQTIGVNTDFSADSQITFLRSIHPPEPSDDASL